MKKNNEIKAKWTHVINIDDNGNRIHREKKYQFQSFKIKRHFYGKVVIRIISHVRECNVNKTKALLELL